MLDGVCDTKLGCRFLSIPHSPPAQVKKLQEQNESLRSAMSTILSVMEDMRHAVKASGAENKEAAEEGGGGDGAAAAAEAKRTATIASEVSDRILCHCFAASLLYD